MLSLQLAGYTVKRSGTCGTVKFPLKTAPIGCIQLLRFINFYNAMKPHKGLNNTTPYEILTAYFSQHLCNQP